MIYRFKESPDVLLVLGQVGCPACAGNLDELNAMGITKVMFCGGGGILDRNIEAGQILVVDGAIRDEGFFYQYIAPSRVAYTNPEIRDKIKKYLDDNDVSYICGLTWTTVRENIDLWRGRSFGGGKWSGRGWRSREGIRFKLVVLCRKLVEII